MDGWIFRPFSTLNMTQVSEIINTSSWFNYQLLLFVHVFNPIYLDVPNSKVVVHVRISSQQSGSQCCLKLVNSQIELHGTNAWKSEAAETVRTEWSNLQKYLQSNHAGHSQSRSTAQFTTFFIKLTVQDDTKTSEIRAEPFANIRRPALKRRWAFVTGPVQVLPFRAITDSFYSQLPWGFFYCFNPNLILLFCRPMASHGPNWLILY